MPQHWLDKQVFLKVYGDFAQQDLTIELSIFRRSDRPVPDPASRQPLITVLGQLPAHPDLAQQVAHHWQQAYRPLFRGQGRGIEPISIKAENISRHTCRASAQSLQMAFEDWLSAPGFQPIRETLLRELNPEDHIQILLQTSDRLLQQLPWSDWQLLQAYPQAALNLSAIEAQPPMVRSPSSPQRRLRILGIFGASDQISTDADRALLTALPPDRVDFQILQQPDRLQISDQLWEQPWDMILFAGHGETSATGQGVLHLNNAGETLSLTDIWYGLRKAVNNGLQLAIFNSCAGLGLLARNLQDDVQIPQMIVMRDVVPDVVAQRFLAYFLMAFAEGQPPYLAAKQARERLHGLEADYPCASWLPVIWQNPYALDLGLSVPSPEAIHSQRPGAMTRRSRPAPWKVASLTLAGLIAVVSLRSPLAWGLNRQGKRAYQQNQLLAAQRYFQAAAAIAPDYAEPRYNLAWLLDEKWGQPEQAQQQYYAAALLGLPEAIAEYVRLRLLKPPLSAAEYSSLYKLTQRCLEQELLPATEASCLKNRGWLRLQQQQWSAAEPDLQAALALRNDSPHTHCLLAQVMEANAAADAALVHWQQTLTQSQDHVQEQDHCRRLAQQRLNP